MIGVIKAADEALYNDKATGRNKVSPFVPAREAQSSTDAALATDVLVVSPCLCSRGGSAGATRAAASKCVNWPCVWPLFDVLTVQILRYAGVVVARC